MQTVKNEIIPQEYLADPHRWVANYADYLYNYAISRLNDEESARDLVQDTFLAALRRVDRFEGRSSERTWLTAILKNKLIDAYRKKASPLSGSMENARLTDQIEFFEIEDDQWKAEYYPKEFGIETLDPLHNKELSNTIKKCIEKLPPLWIAVFTMKHIDDEDTHMICKSLKVSPGNFWVIIHRAKVNLRACLQKNWI
jgi:RNA polymerase sigma-70 factor (TIGR02943 family)